MWLQQHPSSALLRCDRARCHGTALAAQDHGCGTASCRRSVAAGCGAASVVFIFLAAGCGAASVVFIFFLFQLFVEQFAIAGESVS